MSDRAGIQSALEALFTATGQAHHQAFIETDGEDPEWPLWYAEHLAELLPALLGRELTRSELVVTFVMLDRTQGERAPDTAWQTYYAEHFLEQVADVGAG